MYTILFYLPNFSTTFFLFSFLCPISGVIIIRNAPKERFLTVIVLLIKNIIATFAVRLQKLQVTKN